MPETTIAAGLILAALVGAAPQAAEEAAATPPIAFVGVRVVPFDGPRLLEAQTVIVRGDRIAAIGPSSSTPVPDNAMVIPGKGRWLMPGLADMHVHVWSEGDLVAFVANGVTTIRNMFGAPLHLQWRDRLRTGALFGPALYTAGPIIDGNPPTWPGSAVVEDVETAKRVVAEQKAAGYDFLKVYNGLSRDVYDAIVAAGDPVRDRLVRALHAGGARLLLAADPLADVANVRERVGVMLRGEWLPEAELQRRLEEVAASYGND
jgi:hypothetical protein